MEKQFYIYAHCKPDTNDVYGIFYIGKGTALRVSRLRRRNIHHKNILTKYGIENIIVRKIACKSEDHALKLEVEMISVLKRIGVKLTNVTDGGYGTTGYKKTKEQIKAHSDSLKSFYKNNPEAIKRLSESTKDRLANPENRDKIKQTLIEYNNKNPGVSRSRLDKYRIDNPDYNIKQSEKLKEYWKDDERRNEMSVKVKDYFINNPDAGKLNSERQKKYNENPEVRKLKSERIKKHYEKEGAREAASIRNSNRYNDPQQSEAVSNHWKEYYSNPENKINVLEKRKKTWQSDEYRAKQSATMKAYYANKRVEKEET